MTGLEHTVYMLVRAPPTRLDPRFVPKKPHKGDEIKPYVIKSGMERIREKYFSIPKPAYETAPKIDFISGLPLHAILTQHRGDILYSFGETPFFSEEQDRIKTLEGTYTLKELLKAAQDLAAETGMDVEIRPEDVDIFELGNRPKETYRGRVDLVPVAKVDLFSELRERASQDYFETTLLPDPGRVIGGHLKQKYRPK